MRADVAPIRRVAAGIALAGVLAAGGCATPPSDDPEALAAFEETNDPLEPLNRYIFELNYAFDELVFKPLAGWYYVALPNPVQDGVRNALRNLRSPVIAANDLFQGNTARARTTATRFAINSTVGVLGLFDVADGMGHPFHDEDFGQTLAVHGVEEGPYLVVPILGPSNPRDLTGKVVDVFLDPLTYVAWNNDLEWMQYGRAGLEGVDARARNLDTLDEIREGSIDYYATIRSLYRQRREDEIRNGEVGDDYFGVSQAPVPPAAQLSVAE